MWDYYFARNFVEIINDAKISLSNINPKLNIDIGTKISETQLEQLKERKDKLISNVYKARLEELVINKNINVYYCNRCKRLMT